MGRIEIRHGERHVVVEHDGDLAALEQVALALFEATDKPPKSLGPAFGFRSELRHTPPVQSSSMRQAPRPYPIQVRADDSTHPSG